MFLKIFCLLELINACTTSGILLAEYPGNTKLDATAKYSAETLLLLVCQFL
jgi:hypothetical protein